MWIQVDLGNGYDEYDFALSKTLRRRLDEFEEFWLKRGCIASSEESSDCLQRRNEALPFSLNALTGLSRPK